MLIKVIYVSPLIFASLTVLCGVFGIASASQKRIRLFGRCAILCFIGIWISLITSALCWCLYGG